MCAENNTMNNSIVVPRVNFKIDMEEAMGIIVFMLQISYLYSFILKDYGQCFSLSLH